MKNFIKNFLDLIYKKKCYFCRSSREGVKMCRACYNRLEHLAARPNRIVEGKKIYCAGIYSKDLQKLIRGLKYHNQRDLAYFLAKFMCDYMQKAGLQADFTIVPVPQHPNRVKKRKYNHMDLAAEELCKLTGCKLNTGLVRRVKDTAVQYNLSKKQRGINLAGAFEVQGRAPGTVLLIDDICTTGTTFEEIIKELKKSGTDDIICLAASTVSS